MINTSPTFGAAKSGGGASMGASIGPQPGAGNTMSKRVAMQRPPQRRPGGINMNRGMNISQMGPGAGGAMGRGFSMPMGGGNKMRAPNYSGPYGKIPTVGGPPPDMGPQRVQGDGLLAAEQGPVANSAPPMYMPPPGGMTDMSGGNMGATAGMGEAGGASPMLAQYLQGQNRDPRFRY